MPLARELTQPSGEKLIDYAGFVAKLQALSASPRVKLELLDTTAEGRGIWGVVIADPDVLRIFKDLMPCTEEETRDILYPHGSRSEHKVIAELADRFELWKEFP